MEWILILSKTIRQDLQDSFYFRFPDEAGNTQSASRKKFTISHTAFAIPAL